MLIKMKKMGTLQTYPDLCSSCERINRPIHPKRCNKSSHQETNSANKEHSMVMYQLS